MSDLASTSGTGSPSLSSTLRQFRPRKRCSQQGTTTTTPLRDKSPEQRNEPNPPPSQNKDNVLIPEAPEPVFKKAGRELSQSSGGECPDIQATCATSEVVGSGVKRRQFPSSNSEGDEKPKKLGRPINSSPKTLNIECSVKDGSFKRYMTYRERSLKELRKEFTSIDIETVLAALVACNWNVGQARAYLLNKPDLEGNSQQRGQGSEERDVKPSLTDLTGVLRKRGLCSDDLYVENLTKGLSKLKYLGGIRQPQPIEASDDDNNKDCCKGNMDVQGLKEGPSTLSAFTYPEQCEPPQNATRRVRLRRRRLESTLRKAGRELIQSGGRECPDIQATCSTSSLKGSELVGRELKWKYVIPEGDEGIGRRKPPGRPKELGRLFNIPAKKTLQVECSVKDSVAKQYMTDRERSLKELREEFQTTDIEAVLAALVACSWDVGLARTRLLNETHFGGDGQQSCQGSEERDVEPSLANLSGALGKRDDGGFCSKDIYVKNLQGGLSKVIFVSGFRQQRPQPKVAQQLMVASAAEDDSDNDDCCDKSMYVKDLRGGLSKLVAFRDLEYCEPLQNLHDAFGSADESDTPVVTNCL